jgi:hypothetical protein
MVDKIEEQLIVPNFAGAEENISFLHEVALLHDIYVSEEDFNTMLSKNATNTVFNNLIKAYLWLIKQKSIKEKTLYKLHEILNKNIIKDKKLAKAIVGKWRPLEFAQPLPGRLYKAPSPDKVPNYMTTWLFDLRAMVPATECQAYVHVLKFNAISPFMGMVAPLSLLLWQWIRKNSGLPMGRISSMERAEYSKSYLDFLDNDGIYSIYDDYEQLGLSWIPSNNNLFS